MALPSPVTVDLDLNAPQFRSYGWIFDENGAVKTRRTVFLPWGRGVGKSWFRRQIWWTLVAAHEGKLRANCPKILRGVRITSMMPTLKQFRDVHWADIEMELSAGGPWGWLGARLDRQTCQITFPGGSWVKPFPAAAYNARTSRGMRTDLLDADECDDIDCPVYDSVATPWLSEPWSLGLELPGGTPTRGRHGLWWRMLESSKLGKKLRAGEIEEAEVLKTDVALSIRDVFARLPAKEWPETLPRDPDAATIAILKSYYGQHATYRDAPETVSAFAVARAKATTPPASFSREWEADPDAGEGLVYPFDDDFHIREPPPLSAFSEFHIGGDFGWSDPAALLLSGIQGHGDDATVWLLDESYESEIANSIWDKRAVEMAASVAQYGRVTFWPDPSRPERAHDWRNLGLTVGHTDNDIDAGIGRVAELLFTRSTEDGERWSRMYVSPKCRNTIMEIGKYRRKKLHDGTFSEQPEDKWNHLMDCLRYLCMGRFGRAVNHRRVVSGR